MATVSERGLITLVSILFGIGLLAAGLLIGFRPAFFGSVGGAICFGISYLVKFSPRYALQSDDLDDDFMKAYLGLLLFQVALVIGTCSIWHHSLTLFYNGIEKYDSIAGIRSDTSIVGWKENRRQEIHYYCKLGSVPGEVPCNSTYRKGQEVKLLYSSVDNGKPVDLIVAKKEASRFEAILYENGASLYASLIYGLALLFSWFVRLHNQGITLLRKKLDQIQSNISKTFFRVFYFLSYITFIAFVVALFKNIYNLVPFKATNIAIVTGLFLIILLTNIGEKGFNISTNVMLDLESYKFLYWLKQVTKVIAYLSFAFVLYKSIVTNEKSVWDIIQEFFKTHLDLDLGFDTR